MHVYVTVPLGALEKLSDARIDSEARRNRRRATDDDDVLVCGLGSRRCYVLVSVQPYVQLYLYCI